MKRLTVAIATTLTLLAAPALAAIADVTARIGRCADLDTLAPVLQADEQAFPLVGYAA